jgi:hypothetical protein
VEAGLRLLGSDGLSARGKFQPDLSASGVHGAQAARVEVDTLTGRVRVLKMVCMQDCGLPLTAWRSGARSGRHVQALSYGLLEARSSTLSGGWALKRELRGLQDRARVRDPEMVALIDDQDTRP